MSELMGHDGRYLRGRTAPPPADKAHVPFSYGEPESGCSWNHRQQQTAEVFHHPALVSLPGSPDSCKVTSKGIIHR